MNVKFDRLLINRGLSLVHEVLQLPQIPEDLRVRLTEWRSDTEWEIEQADNSERGEFI